MFAKQTFSLSCHAARQSGTLNYFRGGENGEGFAEIWAALRHKPPERKNAFERFFSFVLANILCCKDFPRG